MPDHRTTAYGVIGESLQGISLFLPPPFSAICFALGGISRGIAWYNAKDKTPTAEELAGKIPDAKPGE